MTDADIAWALAISAPRKGFAPHLADDLDSEATLAMVEARADPAAPAGRVAFRAFATARVEGAIARLRKADRRRGIVFRADAIARIRGMGTMSPGQTRKARRNIVIAAAARQGCPQRLLAEVFGLPRSVIADIIAATDPAKSRPGPAPAAGPTPTPEDD